LEAAYRELKLGQRLWGQKIARLYIRRVDTLKAAASAQTLRQLRSLRFHALEGERKDEYAVDLDDAWRLVLTFKDKGMTIVQVEEVSKHYGD
jgi:proteic killer suppression protein